MTLDSKPLVNNIFQGDDVNSVHYSEQNEARGFCCNTQIVLLLLCLCSEDHPIKCPDIYPYLLRSLAKY